MRFLQFGKIKGQAESGNRLWKSQMAFRQITQRLPEDHWHVVGDLPGGTRQAFTGWGGFARTVLIELGITEPTLLSLSTMAIAIISPLILYWIVQRTGLGKFLFERPSWAHLTGSRQARAEAVSTPAE